jgi:hypothetical protein
VGTCQDPHVRCKCFSEENQQFGIPAGRALADPLADEPEPTVEPALEPEPILLVDEPVFDAVLLDPAALDRT